MIAPWVMAETRLASVNSATGGVDEGNIYVRTVPKNERSKSIEELAEQIRQETKHMSGASVSVFTSDFSGGFKQIQLQLRGQDVNALAQAAEDGFEELDAEQETHGNEGENDGRGEVAQADHRAQRR